jgi:hypothetical protein
MSNVLVDLVEPDPSIRGHPTQSSEILQVGVSFGYGSASSDSYHEQEWVISFHCFAFGSRSLRRISDLVSGWIGYKCGYAYVTSLGTLTSAVAGSILTTPVISTAGFP